MRILTDVDDTILDTTRTLVKVMILVEEPNFPVETYDYLLQNCDKLCKERPAYNFNDLPQEHPLSSFIAGLSNGYYNRPDFYHRWKIELIKSPILDLIRNPSNDVTFCSYIFPCHRETKPNYVKSLFPEIKNFKFLAFNSTENKLDYLRSNIDTYDLFCDDQLTLLQEAGVPARKSVTLKRGYIKPTGKEIVYDV